MPRLTAFYFSGTGNTRYVTEKLCGRLAPRYETEIYDISDYRGSIPSAGVLLFAFPVYGSCPPAPMRRFVRAHAGVIAGREAVVVATQYMFSGDGAASLGRYIEKLGGRVTFAEHFNMPNNLADCRLFKIRNGKELAGKLSKADRRIAAFARRILAGTRFRRGFNPVSRAAGYLCQRKWWRKAEKSKYGLLTIDAEKCVGCGLCAKSCPAGNIWLQGGKAAARGKCALCYRCVNLCPQKAVSLIGKQPPAVQYKGPAPE